MLKLIFNRKDVAKKSKIVHSFLIQGGAIKNIFNEGEGKFIDAMNMNITF